MTNATRQMLHALLESAATAPAAREYLRHREGYDAATLVRMIELATPTVADYLDGAVAKHYRGEVARAIEYLARHLRAVSANYGRPRPGLLALAAHADAVASRLRTEWFGPEIEDAP